MKFRLLLTFLGMLFWATGFTQDFSNKGKEFWVGYGYHQIMTSGNAQQMFLYFTSDMNSTVTVEIPATGWSRTYTITANQVTISDEIPKSGGNDVRLTAGGLFDKGIHITATNPVVVYAHILNASVSGAGILYPVATLGKEYYSINYTQSSNTTDANSWFFVIATEDNTTVEIVPSAATTQGWAANSTHTVNLNRGQIYNVMGTVSGNGGVDLTGSRVKSVTGSTGGCKKIAVFSGSGRLNIGCTNGSSDNLFQQALPSSAWGTTFMTSPTSPLSNNVFRIAVSDPTAVVTRNGVPIAATLNNGFYYTITTNQPEKIQSNKPITIAQYISSSGCLTNPGTGDPEMIYLSPVEQTINKVTLYSPDKYQISTHYINVIIKNGGIPSFKLDGSAVTGWQTHPRDASFSYINMPVATGTHNLYSDSGFNAIAYGFGNAESYGFNAGTNVRDLYTTISTGNPNSNVNLPATCVNTDFEFSISLPYQPSFLTWDLQGLTNLLPNNNAVTVTSPTPTSTTTATDGTPLYIYTIPSAYHFTAAGTYQLKVISGNPSSTDPCAGNQENYAEITVYAAPVADFTPTSGCAANPVNFTDATNAQGRTVYKWEWDFENDGTVDASVKNPTHTYSAANTYNVKLVAYSDLGCRAEVVKPVVMSSPITADFTYSGAACTGSTLTFTDNSTPAGAGVQWIWNFDDGRGSQTIGSNAAQTAVYTTPGIKNVTLTVTASGGCNSVPVTKQITVESKPVAVFTAPSGVCMPSGLAAFTDNSGIATATYLWNFGDAASPSNTATTPNASHTYTAAGNYTPTLTVTANGCTSDPASQPLLVSSAPVAHFLRQGTGPVCGADAVSIQNKSVLSGTPVYGSITRVDVIWDYVNAPAAAETDNSPAFDKVYTHSYATSGTYTIRLVAYSGTACTSVEDQTVTIATKPVITFANVAPLCQGAAPVTLTQATPAGGVYSGTGVALSGGVYRLDPAGITTGSTTITYNYTSPQGCVADAVTQNVTVYRTPSVDFTASSPACAGVPVTLTGNATTFGDAVTTWAWNYGDGNTAPSGAAVENHLYAASSYTPSVTITTDKGCSSAPYSAPLTVTAAPVVNIAPPASACLPNATLAFNAIPATYDSYSWNFGDINNGTPGTGATPSHTFTSTGPFTVTVTATQNGCNGSKDIVVNTINPQPQLNAITTVPASSTGTPVPSVDICINNSVTFSQSSTGGTSVITSYAWDLDGDGTTDATGASPAAYTYNTSGTYDATLQVTDNNGCQNSIVTRVVVNDPPTAQIGGSSSGTVTMLAGGSVQLDPAVTGNDLVYTWSGLTPPSSTSYLSSTTVRNPVVTPLTEEPQLLYQLTITGRGGCTMVTPLTVAVNIIPAPHIPNAFSPNFDGIHDRWEIPYLNTFPNCVVEVYNRWGQQVYRSVGYNSPWDGRFKGEHLPIGTYYYIIDPKNGKNKMTGSLTILR